MVSIVAGVLGFGVAGLILWLIRKDRMHVNHGLGWIFVAFGFALLGFSPGVIDWVAQLVGVAYPPILALSLAIVVLVIKILLMDIQRGKLDMRYQRLTQRLAILETKLERAENQNLKN